MFLNKRVSIANGFSITEPQNRVQLPQAHQVGTAKWVTRTVSPQPTSDIAVQLQKEDLSKHLLATWTNKGLTETRNSLAMGYCSALQPTLLRSDCCETISHIDTVLQANNVNQQYLLQTTSEQAKCSDICSGILGLTQNVNEQMMFSIYKVKGITIQCNPIRITLRKNLMLTKSLWNIFQSKQWGWQYNRLTKKIFPTAKRSLSVHLTAP